LVTLEISNLATNVWVRGWGKEAQTFFQGPLKLTCANKINIVEKALICQNTVFEVVNFFEVNLEVAEDVLDAFHLRLAANDGSLTLVGVQEPR